MSRIGICGVAGQMGRTITSLVLEDEQLTLSAACEAATSDCIGQDVGQLVGAGSLGVNVVSDYASLVRDSDVVIDFSHADVTVQLGALCSQEQVGLVIGTTGLSATQLDGIKTYSERVPILMSPNMSVGVNVAFKLVELATKALGGAADVEILEIHHSHKNDSPSGTAVRLGEIVADERDESLDRLAIHGREGYTGERKAGTIGFHSARGGDIVGEHTVFFAGTGERIEITHRAQSRVNFGAGAVRAAHFIAQKLKNKEVGFYDMPSVLGFE